MVPDPSREVIRFAEEAFRPFRPRKAAIRLLIQRAVAPMALDRSREVFPILEEMGSLSELRSVSISSLRHRAREEAMAMEQARSGEAFRARGRMRHPSRPLLALHLRLRSPTAEQARGKTHFTETALVPTQSNLTETPRRCPLFLWGTPRSRVLLLFQATLPPQPALPSA